MVSRITLFEPHFEGVSFGPRVQSGSTDGKNQSSEDEETSAALKIVQAGAVFIILFVFIYLIFSRITNDSADETDVELDSW